MDEEFLLNLSDPGFQWWMKSGPLGFQVYFRCLPSFDTDKWLIRLGPIGDSKTASIYLNQAREVLQSFFPIQVFFCNDREFSITTQGPSHLNFALFENIFLRGENSTSVEHYPDNPQGRSVFYYFHEIAIARRFWIRVEEQISQGKLF